MSEMLKIENIRKVFNPGTINEKVALDGVDLTLEEGGRFRKNLYRRRGCDKVIRASQGTISGTCVPGPDDRYGYHNVH